jgi:hypothetical protein
MKAGFNKLIAHGLTGGVRSRLSGGSKSGFLGSAVRINKIPIQKRVAPPISENSITFYYVTFF